MSYFAKQMAVYQENVSNKNLETIEKVAPTEQNNQMRTVRIILHDPDMTDDSSDDEANKKPKSKTIVREIKMPMVTFSDANESSQNSNDGMRNLGKKRRVLTRTSRQPRVTITPNGVVKYRGVRQRKWGKWAAEIRNPFKGKREWLGTYNTAKEASIAYEIKRLEFDKMESSLNGFVKRNDHKTKNKKKPLVVGKKQAVSSESFGVTIRHSSPSSVLETQSSVVSTIFENNENIIETCSPSNNAIDKDLLPDQGHIMDPNEMTLEDIGKDLDLGTMEIGASFLDCFDGALNGFSNVDEFNLGGFDEKMSSDLPDWDFGEFDDEERAWFDALELGEPLMG